MTRKITIMIIMIIMIIRKIKIMIIIIMIILIMIKNYEDKKSMIIFYDKCSLRRS